MQKVMKSRKIISINGGDAICNYCLEKITNYLIAKKKNINKEIFNEYILMITMKKSII